MLSLDCPIPCPSIQAVLGAARVCSVILLSNVRGPSVAFLYSRAAPSVLEGCIWTLITETSSQPASQPARDQCVFRGIHRTVSQGFIWSLSVMARVSSWAVYRLSDPVSGIRLV